MRKPLELTVYPIWENGFGDFYADKEDPLRPTRVDFEVFRKRLTETDLAAEYWQQVLIGSLHPTDSFHGHSGMKVRGVSSARIRTLHRFATLPHYDEVA
jgi:hypothetical protein